MRRGIRTNADRKFLILRIRQQRHIRLAAGDRSETSELRRQSQRTRSRRAVCLRRFAVVSVCKATDIPLQNRRCQSARTEKCQSAKSQTADIGATHGRDGSMKLLGVSVLQLHTCDFSLTDTLNFSYPMSVVVELHGDIARKLHGDIIKIAGKMSPRCR